MSKILICISGSIAAYKSAELASTLTKAGHKVRVAATESGLKFIGAAALEGITGESVETSMFTASHKIAHIKMAQWADLIILYPASAATLARLRMGLAEDLVSAIFLANNFRAPYWVSPAMNTHMLEHPATQENLSVLEKWGCRILPSDEGLLACGDYGKGKAPSAQSVADLVSEHLATQHPGDDQ